MHPIVPLQHPFTNLLSPRTLAPNRNLLQLRKQLQLFDLNGDIIDHINLFHGLRVEKQYFQHNHKIEDYKGIFLVRQSMLQDIK